MELRNNSPLIFDPHLRQLRRKRAQRRTARIGRSFLIERSVWDGVDRLNDINRSFERVLVMGHPDFTDYFVAQLPDHKVKGSPTVLTGELPQASGLHAYYDLIISGLDLHTIDDVPGYLRDIRQALKPDGLFIGSLFGGDTLSTLRHALYATDTDILGGVSARVYPFMSHTQAAGLLQQAGFALPVIDIDRVSVSYSALDRLISDLRDLGDTNILSARDTRGLTKAYWQTLDAQCPRDPKSGKIPVSFEVYWMTGWAPHDSQQKPLKPGSAKMPLSEALKSVRSVSKD